jgi:hypothetical protein
MKNLILAVLMAIGAASVVVSAQDRVAPLPPLPPLPPMPTVADDSRISWNMSTGDGWTRLHVNARGRIELTEDEKDVKSVPPNGSFEMSSKGWLSLFGQRYVVTGNADGTTSRRYSVGGTERPIDAAARAWISGTIQRLVKSGFGADARVARILSQQGPSGVLDAISLLDSDFVKARYFTLLFKQRLDRPTAERALNQAGRGIGSDFELARVLVAFAAAIPIDEALAPAYVEATGAIGSDFEHARVLAALMTAERPTPAAVKVVLISAPRIRSDFEKARVLGTLAQKKGLGADAVLGIVRAATAIGSDFEQSRVLLQVISSQPIDAATRQALLDTTGRIGSDHERGRVMSAMLREGAFK